MFVCLIKIDNRNILLYTRGSGLFEIIIHNRSIVSKDFKIHNGFNPIIHLMDRSRLGADYDYNISCNRNHNQTFLKDVIINRNRNHSLVISPRPRQKYLNAR